MVSQESLITCRQIDALDGLRLGVVANSARVGQNRNGLGRLQDALCFMPRHFAVFQSLSTSI